MVKTEDLTQGEVYRIQHLSPSYADDDTTAIVQLEACQGSYIYTSWLACPFNLDDVSRINTGVLKCMMVYRTFSEPRIIYIYLSIVNTVIFFIRRRYIQAGEMFRWNYIYIYLYLSPWIDGSSSSSSWQYAGIEADSSDMPPTQPHSTSVYILTYINI